MPTASAVRLQPLDIIRAATTVITARGYYQPLSRQWEKEVPTAMDVETLLFGHEHRERGDGVKFARAATETGHIPAAVLIWCQAGTPEDGDYRAKLARAARAEHVTSREISLLCSAVAAWQGAQRRATRASQEAADAANSRHQGVKGERITRTVTVAAVINQGSRTYGYTEQLRFLVKLRDDDGSIYVWPARPRKGSALPAQGDTIEITATVAKHDAYQDIRQTYVSRLRWKPATTPPQT